MNSLFPINCICKNVSYRNTLTYAQKKILQGICYRKEMEEENYVCQ